MKYLAFGPKSYLLRERLVLFIYLMYMYYKCNNNIVTATRIRQRNLSLVSRKTLLFLNLLNL